MRFVLFYGTIEPLNHFTDELIRQLHNMNHETYAIDVRDPYVEKLEEVLQEGIDAAICYDFIGAWEKELYNQYEVPIINILVDHPMSLGTYIRNVPNKYIQLSIDRNHVTYAKRFFGLKNVFFMPHMASIGTDIREISYEEKDITILFPGGLTSCNRLYQEIKAKWTSEKSQLLALRIIEHLLEKPRETVEKALAFCLAEMNMDMPERTISVFLEHSKAIDMFVRMYYRERVIAKIAEVGIPISIIGGGWDDFASAQKSNVTLLGGRKFGEIFPYMERSRITLTVMPWFKAGTHERIFNSLLHYSCPLTDPSSWLTKHFKSNEECAYYSLEHLDELPGRIFHLLNNPELQQTIIRNGREKVLNNYTSKQITEQILKYLKECYG